MAEFPRVHFRPESDNENSIEPQYTANVHYFGDSHGVQNVTMFQPNNHNFMQPFVPHGSPTPAQRRELSRADMGHSNERGLNMMPYLQHSHWPPSWNTPGVSSYHLGVQQGGSYSLDGHGTVIPSDMSVPPPLHPITAPITQQQCLPTHCVVAGDKTVNKFKDPGSLAENDQMWIDSWLHPRQVLVHPASDTRIKRKVKVWEVKQSLQSCVSLLGELEVLERELELGCKELGTGEWKGKLEEAETKKMMLSECLGVLDQESLSSVRLVLVRRGQKRGRLRGRRVAERAEKRRRLHLEADMWLEGKQAEVEMHKREEMLKQEADAVLWEVRQKQSEGRRILSLLSALVKLHHVRVIKNDPASNPALAENEDQFQVIIDKLSSLWERQMSEYEAEERTLRVMLSENPEGGVRGVKERHKARGDLQRNLRLWESLIFGTGLVSQELSSLGADLCQWLYLHPSKSLDALVENRRQWDKFISASPLATSIPVGWVIPAVASSEEWKALIGS